MGAVCWLMQSLIASHSIARAGLPAANVFALAAMLKQWATRR